MMFIQIAEKGTIAPDGRAEVDVKIDKDPTIHYGLVSMYSELSGIYVLYIPKLNQTYQIAKADA